MYDYEQFLEQIRIIPMDESFKLVRGMRYETKPIETVKLHCVKNSFAMFSVAVSQPEDGLLLVQDRTAFSTKRPVTEQQILRADLTLNGLEAQLFICGMTEDDDGLMKADVLLSAEQAPMIRWQYSQLVMLADIPADAQPGVYSGSIRFYSHAWPYDERFVREVPFEIAVEDITLPSGKDRRFYLNLWQHVFNIARKAEVRPYTDDHIRALEPYAKSLGELGGKAMTVLVSDIPWIGQSCFLNQENISDLYEYNFIRIRRGQDGAFRYDFSFAEKYIAMMRRYGFEEIMFTGLYGVWMNANEGFDSIIEGWPDRLRISYYDEKDGCIRFIRKVSELEDYIHALYAWMVEKDLLGCSYFMGDEVNLGQTGDGWSNAMARLHELMPGMRMDWDVSPDEMMKPPYDREPVDIYTPAIDAIPYTSEGAWDAMRGRIREGGKYLWSVCCWPPVMNSFLYSDLNEVRLHGIITEYLKLDGFLRWNYTVWTQKPRENIVYRVWPAGDTCFVYPGAGGQCLLSLRYLALRRGIEDYELMQTAKALGCGEALEAAFDRVLNEKDLRKWDFAAFDGRERMFSLNAEDYRAARDIVTEAIKARR